jgi:hypothetical protein
MHIENARRAILLSEADIGDVVRYGGMICIVVDIGGDTGLVDLADGCSFLFGNEDPMVEPIPCARLVIGGGS